MGVAPGDPVQLTATVDDTRFNIHNGTEPTQNIQTAEYTIDVPPWSTNPAPVAYPMAAADGSYNEKIEDVVATMDTSGLVLGVISYMSVVRMMMITGDRSLRPFYLHFRSALAPKIEGYIRDYATNAPIQATVTAAPFSCHQRPITGFYSMSVVSGTYDLSGIASARCYAPLRSGVHAQDYQTVRQNFTLMPSCTFYL